MLKISLIVFLVAFIFSYLIILLAKRGRWMFNSDFYGVQKFHIEPTPRIGGIPVFFGLFFGLWLSSIEGLFLPFLAISIPVFLGGLVEDISASMPPIKRMLTTLVSIVIAFVWLEIGIFSIGFEWVDSLLSNYAIISLLFTLIVVGGLVNAINIIDGFNGLMIGYSIFVLLAIAFVANILGDGLVLQLSL